MTTATGDYALTLYNFETLIASSSSFQTECGITDGSAAERIAAARERILWGGQSLPDELPRPFALIEQDSVTKVAEGSGPGGFFAGMLLSMMLERDTALEDVGHAKERQIKFFNWADGVVSDMEALAKGPGYLWVTSITLEDYGISNVDGREGHFDQGMWEVKVF